MPNKKADLMTITPPVIPMFVHSSVLQTCTSILPVALKALAKPPKIAKSTRRILACKACQTARSSGFALKSTNWRKIKAAKKPAV